MVKKKKLPIRWDQKAKENLDIIYDYIAKDSIPAARHVKKELIKLARSLDVFPEKYSKETVLIDDPQNFRSISKWSYKIIYEVTQDQIIIAGIFHTSQHPSKIKRVRK